MQKVGNPKKKFYSRKEDENKPVTGNKPHKYWILGGNKSGNKAVTKAVTKSFYGKEGIENED